MLLSSVLKTLTKWIVTQKNFMQQLQIASRTAGVPTVMDVPVAPCPGFPVTGVFGEPSASPRTVVWLMDVLMEGGGGESHVKTAQREVEVRAEQ